jgi:UDP-N-acetylglucosamine transferase subunit ALG13
MIFVTVGAAYWPFDRMLQPFAELELDEELVVQYGTSSIRPVGARCVEFLPFETLVEHVRDARVVVAHAGIGSILIALANGKRPLVVPRLRRFGEAVDDHQLGSARRLQQEGLVTCVEDLADLPQLVREHARSASVAPSGGRLADELREFVTATVAARGGGASRGRGGPAQTLAGGPTSNGDR